MIAFSRTAKAADYDNEVNVKEIMQIYTGAPKDFAIFTEPRYKFWEYALIIKLLKKESIYEVLDIGQGTDIAYGVICDHFNIKLKEITVDNFMNSKIHHNKYPAITCFGMIDHFLYGLDLFYKILKHVTPNGVVLISTDNDSTPRQKVHVYNSEDFLQMSTDAEEFGYELYGLNEVDLLKEIECIDYIPNQKNPHISLALIRTGL